MYRSQRLQVATKHPLLFTVAVLLVAAVAWLGRQAPSGSSAGSAAAPPVTTNSAPRPDQAAQHAQSQAQPAESVSAPGVQSRGTAPLAESARARSDGGIPALFAKRQGDTWVEASGTIKRVLDDDNDAQGGKHQRWILRLDGAAPRAAPHEILIAHEFEAAGRVPVKEGERVWFRGEYEWTDKGGTVHFTHAPKFKRKEPGGWIEHLGVRYE